MSFLKNEKFQKIFYPIFYFAFTIAITISGCYIFDRNYYTNIFVSGDSMVPTLVGSGTYRHYGIADTSSKAIDGLRRFDVLITYYPKEWGSYNGLIVKRVWGFPGETISLHSDSNGSTFTVTSGGKVHEFTATVVNKSVDMITEKADMNLYKFVTDRKVFYTNAAGQRNMTDYTLGKNEYFVMGDNWASSTDCYHNRGSSVKLTKNYLQGKVVCIQGYGKVEESTGGDYTIKEKHPIKARYII